MMHNPPSDPGWRGCAFILLAVFVVILIFVGALQLIWG